MTSSRALALTASLSRSRWARLLDDRPDRLHDLEEVLQMAYDMGRQDASRSASPGSQLFFLPRDGTVMVDRLCVEILNARARVLMVSFLPPDRRISGALSRARQSLGAPTVQVILDATTQASVGRVALPWAEQRVLSSGGTIHAKAVLVDDTIWWGSWNFSAAAARQVDLVQRVENPKNAPQVMDWLAEIRERSEPADITQRPRGPYRDSPEQVQVQGPRDPDLGF